MAKKKVAVICHKAYAYLSLLLRIMKRISITHSINGKMRPTRSPILMLPPNKSATLPTIAGPIPPPRSPAIAKSANIAVPPVGKALDEILMVPGHMRPTENPQTTQPIRPTNGLFEKEAII